MTYKWWMVYRTRKVNSPVYSSFFLWSTCGKANKTFNTIIKSFKTWKPWVMLLLGECFSSTRVFSRSLLLFIQLRITRQLLSCLRQKASKPYRNGRLLNLMWGHFSVSARLLFASEQSDNRARTKLLNRKWLRASFKLDNSLLESNLWEQTTTKTGCGCLQKF